MNIKKFEENILLKKFTIKMAVLDDLNKQLEKHHLQISFSLIDKPGKRKEVGAILLEEKLK